jgi:rod shape-determining protein MreC
MYNLQSSAAHVIAGSTNSWTQSVMLDKGKSSGFVVGMPVTDSSGAVGQIIECSSTTCTVRLLTDEESSISAMIQSTRAQGMLEGSIDGTLHLSYIRTDQTVNVGDLVVTSGLGGVFPKGLPLGKVSVVDRTPGSTYYSIVVEPFGRLDNLEEVLVITSLTEEQQATTDEIEESDAADKAAVSGSMQALEDDDDEDSQDDDAQAKSKDKDEDTASGAYVSPYTSRGEEE